MSETERRIPRLSPATRGPLGESQRARHMNHRNSARLHGLASGRYVVTGRLLLAAPLLVSLTEVPLPSETRRLRNNVNPADATFARHKLFGKRCNTGNNYGLNLKAVGDGSWGQKGKNSSCVEPRFLVAIRLIDKRPVRKQLQP